MTEKINEAFSQSPLWAKLLATLGFPIFVALWLMAQDAGFFPSVTQANNELLRINNKLIELNVDQHGQQIYLLATLCIHNASTDAERRQCLVPLETGP